MNTKNVIEILGLLERDIKNAENDIESLDRAIGDGDHYINIIRGIEAISAIKTELLPLSPSEALHKIGFKLLNTIGGASGPLLGSFFIEMSKNIAGQDDPDRHNLAIAFQAGVDAIRNRGKADVGEKTMLDVLIPVSRTYNRLIRENISLAELCSRLESEAESGMLATRDMLATKGRASFLGARAVGHIDPGSMTCYIIIKSICSYAMKSFNQQQDI